MCLCIINNDNNEFDYHVIKGSGNILINKFDRSHPCEKVEKFRYV